MYGPFGRHKIIKLVSHLATDSKYAWKYLALRSREITCRHNVIHMMWTTWAETWKTGDTNKCVGKFAITDAAVWKCVCVCALAGKRNVDADFDFYVDNSKRIQFDACAFAPFFYSSHFPYHFPSLTFVDSLAHFFFAFIVHIHVYECSDIPIFSKSCKVMTWNLIGKCPFKNPYHVSVSFAPYDQVVSVLISNSILNRRPFLLVSTKCIEKKRA